MASSHLSDRDLLLLLDCEPPVSQTSGSWVHVRACPDCQSRLEALEAAEAQFRPADDPATWESELRRARARATLEARLVAEPPAARGWLAGSAAVATAAIAVAALLLSSSSWRLPSAATMAGADAQITEPGALPIRHLTPGATERVVVSDLCRAMPVEPAPIPEPVRLAVLEAYGMVDIPEHEYELDYLVTPDLGGSPHPRNLWPEPYDLPVWNARVKDELETLLPQLVCDGRLDLRTAQREIATNWIAAYKKYFKTDRPVRLSSHVWSRSARPDGPAVGWNANTVALSISPTGR